MLSETQFIADDIHGYLEAQRTKTLLRFITCGSVDDGKSTLIGRLLYDAKMIFEDQLAAVTADSKNFGTVGGDLDLALLVDGLTAEREQGITIDVAYRFFTTAKRKFIVADTPGHEQYTRNMATGASTADLAVILIDARKGVLPQTRRHSAIVSLLGIRHILVAINKMDLVGYDPAVFDAIKKEYDQVAAGLGLSAVTYIPVSALKGDNITTVSPAIPWYQGPALIDFLDTVDPTPPDVDSAFRMPVQWVARPNLDFRGFAGTLSAGTVRPGDPVVALPSGARSSVKRIVTADGDLDAAIAGQAVMLTLADEIDISRGDVLTVPGGPTEAADQFEASLVWMSEHPLLPGRPYAFKLAARAANARLQPPKFKLNINTMEQLAARTLQLNDIGRVVVTLDRAIGFEPYAQNRDLGGFILIDRMTNETVAAGMIHFPLRRAQNVKWQALDVTKAARARLMDQRPAVLWFTGLSGSGKSTIANLVEKKLHSAYRHTYLLDGDNIRHGLNKDLGFTDADRVENIRRIGEVAKLMTDAGLIVICSFISPFRAERQMVSEMMGEGEFIEIFVDTPLAVAEERDVKGLYKKARAGLIKNFTGIDSAYEPPMAPDIVIDTTRETAEQAALRIIAKLASLGVTPDFDSWEGPGI